MKALMTRSARVFTCLIALLYFAPANLAQELPRFKAYVYKFSQGPDPVLNTNGVAHPASRFHVSKTKNGTQIDVDDTGLWRGYFSVGLLGQWAGYAPLFGGERLHVTYTYTRGGSSDAPDATGFAIQYYGGQIVDIALAAAMVADGQQHDIEFVLPDSAKTKHICALWVRVDNSKSGGAHLLLHEFSWDRLRVQQQVNADDILRMPPPHNARIGSRNGVVMIFVDDKPISALGWGAVIPHNVGNAEVQDMVGKTNFPLDRTIFTLGEHIPLEQFPPSWLGPEQFDFSYLDQQIKRLIDANPKAMLLLQVALDGAHWWNWMHPESATFDVDSGIPDYLSPQWRQDSRYAIRQMVAHIQSSPYAQSVIGYQLMNGPTEDCTFEVDTRTKRGIQRFRDWLRNKYINDAALRLAWNSPDASIDSALPDFSAAEFQHGYASEGVAPLLLEPRVGGQLADKIAFHAHLYQQVILNFAHDVKEATQGRAIVGARVGDFMGNIWTWPAPLGVQQYPIDELTVSKDFDYFEVQEPYIGRGIADYSSGVPVLPPQGMAGHNKLIVIQNDIRTHLSAPDSGYGRTVDLPSTLAVQRRVFVNSLVLGTYPYLWQQAYHYNDPQMLADFRRQEVIYRKALSTDRSTGAEIAFVFDINYRKYMGCEPLQPAPSRGAALFDYLKFTWARAGVPFDMIFLDQLRTAKPYKVYVFVHTVGLTDEQRALIQSVVRRDKRVGVFIWADGLIDGMKADAGKMSDLIGMNITMSTRPSMWKMEMLKSLRSGLGAQASLQMGTLSVNEPADPSAPNNIYSPSFAVTDRNAEPIATYSARQWNRGAAGIAIRRTADWSSIYSASPILTPTLLRYILNLSGAHLYTNTEDASYINRSFIGFHANQSHKIHVTLPDAEPLYDLFGDLEMPASKTFDIPVERGQTYLLFRGDKKTWQQLGETQTGQTTR